MEKEEFEDTTPMKYHKSLLSSQTWGNFQINPQMEEVLGS